MDLTQLLERLKREGHDSAKIADPLAPVPVPQTSDVITPQPVQEDPMLAADGPSLFDRTSSAIDKKEMAGDVGMPSAAPGEPGLGKASLAASKKTVTDRKLGSVPQPEKTPSVEPEPLDSGYQLGTLENLDKAQKDSRLLRNMAGFADVGTNYLNSMSNIADGFVKNPSKIDFGKGSGDFIRGEADQIQKDLASKVENQKNDPASQMSAEMRNIVRQMGFPVSDKVSSVDLEKKFPGLANIYTQREAQKARADIASENRKARLEDRAYDRETRLEMAKISAEGKKEDKANKLNDKQRGFIQGLRKEATTGQYGKAYEAFATANRATKALSEYAKDPNGYTDYGTLMLGLKSLQGDQSVVREAEIKLGMNAADLATKIANWQSSIANGQTLTPAQRQQIVETTKILANTAQTQYQNAVAPLMAQAEEEGIDPKLIFSAGIMGDSPKTQPAAEMVKMQAPDGSIRMVPKDKVEAATKAGGKVL